MPFIFCFVNAKKIDRMSAATIIYSTENCMYRYNVLQAVYDGDSVDGVDLIS